VDPEDGYVAESGEAAAVLQARKKAVSAERGSENAGGN
jgi:hypothetical protein